MRAAALAILTLFPVATAAQGLIIPRCGVARCGPVPVSSLLRVSSDVRVRLAQRVLQYEIEETFENRGRALGEADYIFPLPEGAAFQDLQLEINGQMVAGETMNASEARRVYEEIVRRKRDPALVEWMGHGLLRARIFPIAPGERKRVIVRYQMVAPREGDALRVDHFRGARSGVASAAASGGDGRVSFTLSYPSSEPLGRPWSPTHLLDIEQRDDSMFARVRGDARDVAVLVPIKKSGQAVITALMHAPGGEDGFVLLTLTPPAASPRVTPRDITFVLDVSGSMSGAKMEQAREAGRQLLATLTPADRFRMIDFASGVHTFRDDYVRATRANVRDAQAYLDELRANGGTNIGGALEASLTDHSDMSSAERRREILRPRDGDEPENDLDGGERLALVLFVTDGEPTVGERNPEALVQLAKRLRGDTRLFTFGLGADVNVTLLEQLALGARGTAQFVRPEESVERAVGLVAERLTSPVATGVRLRAAGVRLRAVYPEGPYDIFAGQDLTVLARYEGSGAARLRFEGVTADGPVVWQSRAVFPDRNRRNSFVPRLWAAQRLGWLSAERRVNGGSTELDEEIRQLGERYGIPTELTSYIVLEQGFNGSQVLGRSIGDKRTAGTASQTVIAPEREMRFEAARDAAAKRSAVSLQSVDRLANESSSGKDARTAANRRFVLIDSVWTDQVDRPGAAVVTIKPYSPAYFALTERLPELRDVFAVGERVRVAGRNTVIVVNASGAANLSVAGLERIAANW